MLQSEVIFIIWGWTPSSHWVRSLVRKLRSRMPWGNWDLTQPNKQINFKKKEKIGSWSTFPFPLKILKTNASQWQKSNVCISKILLLSRLLVKFILFLFSWWFSCMENTVAFLKDFACTSESLLSASFIPSLSQQTCIEYLLYVRPGHWARQVEPQHSKSEVLGRGTVSNQALTTLRVSWWLRQ